MKDPAASPKELEQVEPNPESTPGRYSFIAPRMPSEAPPASAELLPESQAAGEVVRLPLILRALWLSAPHDVNEDALGNAVEARVLSDTEVFAALGRAELALAPATVRAALAKGDRCVGVIADGAVLSYAWYASTPTDVVSGVTVTWTSPAMILVYGGYTLREHRGRGLFSAGLARAASLLTRTVGPRTFFGFAPPSDLAPLAAARRAGYCADGGMMTTSAAAGRQGVTMGRARDVGITLVVE